MSKFYKYEGQVNCGLLNCRKSPSFSSEIVKIFSLGEKLEVLKESDEWGQVKDGWVCLKYIDKIRLLEEEDKVEVEKKSSFKENKEEEKVVMEKQSKVYKKIEKEKEN